MYPVAKLPFVILHEVVGAFMFLFFYNNNNNNNNNNGGFCAKVKGMPQVFYQDSVLGKLNFGANTLLAN